MLSTAIGWIMSLFAQGYAWFVSLVDAMEDGNGWTYFLSIFLAFFVINRFIDLVIMRFIYSPSSVDRSGFIDGVKKMGD